MENEITFCDFDMDSCFHRNYKGTIIYYACICHSALMDEYSFANL
ncbi:hypothetical protein [Candidatus Cloacimonas acidaminovorans]|nr:hypothetical protein [Candidatus Cloacimonas acidaminovorans]